MSLIHILYLIWVNRIDIGFFIPLTFQKKKKKIFIEDQILVSLSQQVLHLNKLYLISKKVQHVIIIV